MDEEKNSFSIFAITFILGCVLLSTQMKIPTFAGFVLAVVGFWGMFLI